MSRYIFGPVPSRRLGISLGIDVIPFKTCTLNCLYCECGKTTIQTISRKSFFPPEELIPELQKTLDKIKHIDYITFSGSGEPTLNSDLGNILKRVKEITNIPIAVITNSTLIWDNNVSNALLESDVVLPSLDSVTQDIFEKINKPVPGLKIDKIIEGLKRFSKTFQGKLWVEIFFASGLNDGEKELERMQSVLEEINPQKIQLNSLDRPPAFSGTGQVKMKKLEQIKNRWSNMSVEIIKRTESRSEIPFFSSGLETDIIDTIERRPLTINDLEVLTQKSESEIRKYIDILEKEKRVRSVVIEDKIFYTPERGEEKTTGKK